MPRKPPKALSNFVRSFKRTTTNLTQLPLSRAYEGSCADTQFMEDELGLNQKQILDWQKKCDHDRLLGVRFVSKSCFCASVCHKHFGFFPMEEFETHTYVGICRLVFV